MTVIDIYCDKVIKKAKQLQPDVTIDNGINWIWALGFSSHDKAKEFDSFCCNNGCETRGVYSGKNGYDVRFR